MGPDFQTGSPHRGADEGALWNESPRKQLEHLGAPNLWPQPGPTEARGDAQEKSRGRRWGRPRGFGPLRMSNCQNWVGTTVSGPGDFALTV